MSIENKEFYDLLDSIVNEQTFDFELSNGLTVKCKQLTTAQLKQLIETVVDSPITQSTFTSTVIKIFNESVSLPLNYTPTLLDKLLFLVDTRINSISPNMTVIHNEEQLVIDFIQVKQNIINAIKTNELIFADKQLIENGLTLTVGIPTLVSELQLNEEIYKNLVVNSDDPDELRKVLGETFVNEIAKSFKLIKIQDKTLDLSTISFKKRLKTIESLPASSVQQAIKYVEEYKRLIEQVLVFKEYNIPLDGSLFSIY